MFNIGFGEMIFIAIIALIFVGPKQLPELARVLGRTLNELKNATSELTKTFTDTARDLHRETTQISHFELEKPPEPLPSSMDPVAEKTAVAAETEVAHHDTKKS